MADSSSTFDKVAGKVKETAGKVAGNKELETEGRLQNLEGKAEEKADDVKDTLKGAVDRFKKND